MTGVDPESDGTTAANRHVVVAIHQDGFAQRELLCGFCRQIHEIGGVDLHYLPRLSWDLELARGGLPWRPDGILLYNEGVEIDAAVAGYGIPYVDLGSGSQRGILPYYEEAAVGRLAAEHLRERGFRRFACIGLDEWHGDPRSTAFSETVTAAPRLGVTLAGLDRPDSWQRILAWMTALPLPCGLFCATDRIAQVVASAAVHLGLSIPEEVGIFGVDADPVLSRLSPVPLSSVRIPYQANGAWAARVLDALMAGRPLPPMPETLAPSGVVIQRSSDRRSHDDALVDAANAWIRDHLAEAPSIDAIAEALAVGRRTLERRYRAVTGASMLTAIQHLRLDRGRLLLRQGASVQATAEALGLTPGRFIAWFRKVQRVTPGEYRSLWRQRDLD